MNMKVQKSLAIMAIGAASSLLAVPVLIAYLLSTPPDRPTPLSVRSFAAPGAGADAHLEAADRHMAEAGKAMELCDRHLREAARESALAASLRRLASEPQSDGAVIPHAPPPEPPGDEDDNPPARKAAKSIRTI
jgi:hypothetical protein